MAGGELLWLLLPIAAASGWYAARRVGRQDRAGAGGSGLHSDYFKGINYLLNEQPDKAIEVFIRVLEVDSETVETHLALGNLYRRRGEVDRAIRIHQNLIERPGLEAAQRAEALLELGQDYLGAGLLDRAENIFQELAEAGTYRVQALRQLIDIYEQEKDWEAAIASAQRLESATGNQLGAVVAQYRCEQAEQAKNEGDTQAAMDGIRAALGTHRGCVRASLVEGDLHSDLGNHQAAIAAYKRVEEQDPDYVPVTVNRIHRCYMALERPDEMKEYLSGLMDRYGWITATLALADLTEEERGVPDAIAFMAEQLRRRASVRGLDRLLELELEGGESSIEHLTILKDLTSELLADRPVYKCTHCGFPAKSMHWQCPSCKHWDSVKPIQGVEGE